jgi:opacity protein-like surface antigen
MDKKYLGAALVLAAMWPLPAAAQFAETRGSARISAGSAKLYLDEPAQFAWGASVRFRIAGRFSLEPEFVASRGRRFTEWTLIPNLVVDLGAPGKRVTPYIIGGVGYRHEVDKSITVTRYVTSGKALTAGAGVRVRIVGSAFLSPEIRVGSISRVAVGFGVLF